MLGWHINGSMLDSEKARGDPWAAPRLAALELPSRCSSITCPPPASSHCWLSRTSRRDFANRLQPTLVPSTSWRQSFDTLEDFRQRKRT